MLKMFVACSVFQLFESDFLLYLLAPFFVRQGPVDQSIATAQQKNAPYTCGESRQKEKKRNVGEREKHATKDHQENKANG